MKKKLKYIIVPVIIFIVLQLLFLSSFWQSLEHKSNDLFFIMRGEQPISEDVVIVEVGDETFGTLDQRWPFDRALHARLINNLEKAGVKMIIFDVEFTEKTNPQSDKLLSETAGSYDNVIMSGKLIKTIYDSSVREQFLKPLKSMIDRGVQWGMVNISADEDGFVRKYEMFQKRKNELKPSIGAVALGNVYGIEKNENAFSDHSGFFQIGKNFIPKSGSKSAFINFFGPARYFSYFDYADIVDDSTYVTAFEKDLDMDLNLYYEKASELKNKIVLVGLTAVEAHDTHHTPFFSQDQQMTPGVEIHANFIEMALQQKYLRQYSFFKYLLIFFLAAIVNFALNSNIKPSLSIFLSLAFIIGYIAASFFIFKHKGLLIPTLEIPAQILVMYITGLVFQYIKTVKERKFIKSAFGQYIAPELVDELIKDPKKLEYGGVSKEITVFFSDIVSFTPFTEKHSTKETVDMLREYLTAMVDVIIKNKGTLDKFVGDEIVALFGAPLDLEDHAYWACKTAVESRMKLTELQEKWKADGKDSFNIGIGLNSGSVTVGNLGSEQIFDYTAIGDNMNAGARIESATRNYKTKNNILISGSTYELAKDKIIAEFVDNASVKGKANLVPIYDLQGMKQEITEP